MAPTYIVGYEATGAATAALTFTRRLAGATGADVVAAYVYPDLRPVPSSYGPVDLIAHNPDLTAVARGDAERVVADVPDDVAVIAIAGASVPHELDVLARSEHAALLAVGATHRGSIGRLVPGSIGERVVHGSPCPVLVVPDRDGERTVSAIGVAFDGREQSRRALRAATVLARRLDAALVLIGAVDPGPSDPLVPHLPDPQPDRELSRGMRTTLERTAAQLLQRGFGVSIRVALGAPGAAIAGACSDGIDLLVAGSRAHRPMRNLLAGSVSRYLVDHAPCPVLVVPQHTAIALVAGEQPAAPAATRSP